MLHQTMDSSSSSPREQLHIGGPKVCLRPYTRENLTDIVPNSLDEDLQLGPDRFLTLQSDRKWLATPLQTAMRAPMSPLRDPTGEILKRTVLGEKAVFAESFGKKSSMQQATTTMNSNESVSMRSRVNNPRSSSEAKSIKGRVASFADS